MDIQAAPTLLSLPPELQTMIVDSLTKHDLTVCVRVCKAWHNWFINDIWHTFDCFGADFGHSSFRHFKATNTHTNYISDGEDSNSYTISASDNSTMQMSGEASVVLFTRQIHQIRILELSYLSDHDLFYEEPLAFKKDSDKVAMDDGHALSTGLPDLCLEELCIDFQPDPGFLLGSEYYVSGQTSKEQVVDSRPPFQILERSRNLKKLTINLELLLSRGQGEDVARLMAALPSSLERLTLELFLPVTLTSCRMFLLLHGPLVR